MRKHREQKFGLNPEWVREKITIPTLKIAILAVIIFTIFTHCRNYAEHKAQEKIEQKEIQESISAEESIIAESKRAKEQMLAEEEAKRESLARIEVEVRKTNTLYENEVSKKIMPIGTYVRNDKEKKVGRVIGYYGLEIITNNEWNFTLDSNGIVPDFINVIGYSEYTKSLKKQREREEKKYNKENADRIQKIIDAEIAKLTETTKSKLTTNFIKLGNEYYRVWEVKGDQLYCIKKGVRKKKSNYIQITYSDVIECVDYITYEVGK